MSTLLSEDNGRFFPLVENMRHVLGFPFDSSHTVWDRKPQWCIISRLVGRPCMGINSSARDTVAQAANIYFWEVGVERASESSRWHECCGFLLVSHQSKEAGRQTRRPTGRPKGSSSPTAAQWGLSHSRNCQQLLHCQKHILLNIVLEEQPAQSAEANREKDVSGSVLDTCLRTHMKLLPSSPPGTWKVVSPFIWKHWGSETNLGLLTQSKLIINLMIKRPMA